MKRITYKAGQFSQVVLPDSTRLWIQVRPGGIRVRRMIGPLVPGKTLWEFSTSIPVRAIGPAGPLGAAMLDLVLEALQSSDGLEEALAGLKSEATAALTRVVAAASTSSGDLQRDTDDGQIIRDYGVTLEQLGSEGRMLVPISRLPHPKERIAAALRKAIETSRNPEETEWLRIVARLLEDFVPDDQVPADRIDNLLAWADRQGEK